MSLRLTILFHLCYAILDFFVQLCLVECVIDFQIYTVLSLGETFRLPDMAENLVNWPRIAVDALSEVLLRLVLSIQLLLHDFGSDAIFSLIQPVAVLLVVLEYIFQVFLPPHVIVLIQLRKYGLDVSFFELGRLLLGAALFLLLKIILGPCFKSILWIQ